uniref:Leucine-rich repeat extensin-like protein 3 n=1 Tax=Cicer arietinum TaxID=3827 RepID=A0A3Q7X5J0_CICAR|nr:leucine-rich repeat extensin-like protein 3 [Cicer arietinum]
MPSSALDNKVPHSILFPGTPLHSLPPRVFGSTCFVHNLTPGLDKLSARSLKCVFLGYHRSQKGYRCYSPTLRRYLISVDVTFFESVTYYESLPDPLSATIPLDLPKSISPSLLPLEPITYAPPETPPVAHPTVPLETPLVDPPTVQPLQTYRRRQPPSVVHVSTPVHTEVIPDAPSPPPPSLSDPTLDIFIAIRKGIRPTRNPSPHYIGLSYHRLSPLHYTCLSSLSSVSIPKSPGEALSHPEWR